jgi:hypothetical protein
MFDSIILNISFQRYEKLLRQAAFMD